MRLLILGGPRFLGFHLAEAALARGHEPTFFNRGRTEAHVLPDVTRLVGDRAGDLAALRGGRWDGIVDTSGHVPRQVAAAARVLSGHAPVYLYVSSISVMSDMETPGQDESAPVARLDDPDPEEMTLETYGAC